MISADTAFERVANAAAAAFSSPPPYIAYRVEVRATGAALRTTDSHFITVRTFDGQALMRDREGGPPVAGAPLPLAPSVDALAEWAFAFDTSGGHARLNVAYQRPLRYIAPVPAPGDTVVVASVAGYSVAYAPDDANHLHLEPATSEKRAFASEANHFVYRDVWFDPQTYLPTRVVVAAVDEMLTVDYIVADRHWLLRGFIYDGRLDSARDGDRARIEASYAQYEFPSTVPGL